MRPAHVRGRPLARPRRMGAEQAPIPPPWPGRRRHLARCSRLHGRRGRGWPSGSMSDVVPEHSASSGARVPLPGLAARHVHGHDHHGEFHHLAARVVVGTGPPCTSGCNWPPAPLHRPLRPFRAAAVGETATGVSAIVAVGSARRHRDEPMPARSSEREWMAGWTATACRAATRNFGLRARRPQQDDAACCMVSRALTDRGPGGPRLTIIADNDTGGDNVALRQAETVDVMTSHGMMGSAGLKRVRQRRRALMVPASRARGQLARPVVIAGVTLSP